MTARQYCLLLSLPSQKKPRLPLFLSAKLIALLLAITPLAAAEDTKKSDWSVALFAGPMTNNTAAGAINPQKVSFADNNVAGVVLGYDYALGDSRWSLGAELQFNWHFGYQEFGEVALPMFVRYRPELKWLTSFQSLAYGLGGSVYTEVAQLEVDLAGSSRKSLIYWFLEAEFGIGEIGDSVFARLHHRSDGYGALKPPAGSNALVLGYRHAF